MSRSGYSCDLGNRELNIWRGAVAQAIRGKRGKTFLSALIQALDALPEKRLIAGDLQSVEGCCAMGAVARSRALATGDIDVFDRHEVGRLLDIAPALAAEVAYENDEGSHNESPEQRFTRMRAWAERALGGGA